MVGKPTRTGPIRIAGEAEGGRGRTSIHRIDVMLAANRKNARGKYIHRHKGKSTRRHPIKPSEPFFNMKRWGSTLQAILQAPPPFKEIPNLADE